MPRRKEWIKGFALDDRDGDYLDQIESLRYVKGKVAVFPNHYWNDGVMHGLSLVTRGAVSPGILGKNLADGILAVKLTLLRGQLPAVLHGIRTFIEASVPHGKNNVWKKILKENEKDWSYLSFRYEHMLGKHPKLPILSGLAQLGTLDQGGYIDIREGSDGNLWLLVRAGSRDFGVATSEYFQKLAVKEMSNYFIELPDNSRLAFFPKASPLFEDYLLALSWCESFAQMNRRAILRQTVDALMRYEKIPKFEVLWDTAFTTQHNYVAEEAGRWVSRVGACSLYPDQLAVLRGAVNRECYIVRGLNTSRSYNSFSFGAGRLFPDDFAPPMCEPPSVGDETPGVECESDPRLLRELPSYYKDVAKIYKSQEDLADIQETLRPVVSVLS